ncbi:MAG: hypothetical protein ACPGU5_01745 [Lishizhenia sp.]
MKKHLFGALLFISLPFFGSSQQYTTSVGLKGGLFGWGALNGKHFISRSNALEATIGGGRNFTWLELLYEWQNPTDLIDGLDWYFGAGGAFGTWSKNYNSDDFNSGFHLGARAVIGLDYTFSNVPINLGLDTGPYLSLINGPGFGWHGGFALRYILKR